MPTALVTGAASGIGACVTDMLLTAGWQVHGLDLATAALPSHDRLIAVPCDVRDAAQVARACAAIPRLNALIPCAGILRTGPIAEAEVEDFDIVFNVNMRGSWLCAKHAMPALKAAAAAGELARIVFLSSIAAIRPKINGGIYAASKAAVSQMTKVLAVECAEYGVLVNALAPATVDTPMVRPALQGQALNNQAPGANTGRYKPSGVSPLGRIALPEDVARMVRVLLSEDTSYITGAIIPVDGGTSAAFVPA